METLLKVYLFYNSYESAKTTDHSHMAPTFAFV